MFLFFILSEFKEKFKKFRDVPHFKYNYIRPHQSLDYLTPYEYYQQCLKNQKNNMSLM